MCSQHTDALPCHPHCYVGICTPDHIYTVRSSQLVQGGTAEPDGTCYKVAGFSAGQACAVAQVSALTRSCPPRLPVVVMVHSTAEGTARRIHKPRQHCHVGCEGTKTCCVCVWGGQATYVRHDHTGFAYHMSASVEGNQLNSNGTPPRDDARHSYGAGWSLTMTLPGSCVAAKVGLATVWWLAAAMSRQEWAGSAHPFAPTRLVNRFSVRVQAPPPAAGHAAPTPKRPHLLRLSQCAVLYQSQSALMTLQHLYWAGLGPSPLHTGLLMELGCICREWASLPSRLP